MKKDNCIHCNLHKDNLDNKHLSFRLNKISEFVKNLENLTVPNDVQKKFLAEKKEERDALEKVVNCKHKFYE